MTFGTVSTVQNSERDVVPVPAGLQEWWYTGPAFLGMVTCHGGILASASCTVLKQVPMLKWGVCVQDVGSDSSSWIINWDSALTEEASESVRFIYHVKKETLLPEWQSAVLEGHCHSQRGRHIPTDLSFESSFYVFFMELTKNSFKVFYDDSCKKNCHDILAQTDEFWLFTTIWKSHRRYFLLNKSHGKSGKRSVSSKTHKK